MLSAKRTSPATRIHRYLYRPWQSWQDHPAHADVRWECGGGGANQWWANCICLYGFNITYKQLRSHHNGAWLHQYSATQECHAPDTRHDIPTRHSIQTRGRPVSVLSIDVERHSGIHNYPNFMSWVRPDREILPQPSTHASERSTLLCCNGHSQSEAR